MKPTHIALVLAACSSFLVSAKGVENNVNFDLRPKFDEYGIGPRNQEARGTCSVFVVLSSYEYLFAHGGKSSIRLSPEFINWAANESTNEQIDGSFFRDALTGIDSYGICSESDFPYNRDFDPENKPSKELIAIAKENLKNARASLSPKTVWIAPHGSKQGLSHIQVKKIVEALEDGWPVAIGSAHSLLLVGYSGPSTDLKNGTFHVINSAGAQYETVTYDYLREKVYDVFYVKARTLKPLQLKEL